MINDCANFALERRQCGLVMYGTREQIAIEMDKRVALGQEVAMHGFRKWKNCSFPMWKMLACSVNWRHFD